MLRYSIYNPFKITNTSVVYSWTIDSL